MGEYSKAGCHMMEWIEQITKLGAVIGFLGVVIGAVIGAFSWGRVIRRTLNAFVFMKYTERYEQIMTSFPVGVHSARLDLHGEPPEINEPLKLAILRYLNLCSEEFTLWQSKYIANGVWKIWQAELERTLVSPLYRKAWLLLRKEFESYPDFCEYVERVQRMTLENVRRWSMSGQPKRWVEERNGQWDHKEWYSLLESLQKSEFWPMDPKDVGTVLEQLKAEFSEKRKGGV
jgi:hypothetical protein